MISPDVNQKLTQEIYALYSSAEAVMLQRVARRVKAGIQQDGWTEQKLRQVSGLREELKITLTKLEKDSVPVIEEAIYDSYRKGINSANKDLDLELQTLANINIPFKIQRLALETGQNIKGTHLNILRNTDDVYRSVISEVTGGAVSGVQTRRQVAQLALNLFADKGITGFVDKAGRKWEMSTYAEAATRGAVGRAAIEGHIDRQRDVGRDLVIISDHPSECPLCRPYEGQILSLSGNDPNHGSLPDAISNGLFHINCRHSLSGYIPGLSKVAPGKADPTGYETTQQQRYNERMIRKWKRRELVALSPEESANAASKVKWWQTQQRDLISENPDIRRKYHRESIKRAR